MFHKARLDPTCTCMLRVYFPVRLNTLVPTSPASLWQSAPRLPLPSDDVCAFRKKKARLALPAGNISQTVKSAVKVLMFVADEYKLSKYRCGRIVSDRSAVNIIQMFRIFNFTSGWRVCFARLERDGGGEDLSRSLFITDWSSRHGLSAGFN